MTNLKVLQNSALSLKEVVGFSSVWDFHAADHLDNLVKKKGSNLFKFVELMKSKGKKGAFTMYVDNIGRSAHSASRVVILKGITSCEEMGSHYYSKRMGEFFIL